MKETQAMSDYSHLVELILDLEREKENLRADAIKLANALDIAYSQLIAHGIASIRYEDLVRKYKER